MPDDNFTSFLSWFLFEPAEGKKRRCNRIQYGEWYLYVCCRIFNVPCLRPSHDSSSFVSHRDKNPNRPRPAAADEESIAYPYIATAVLPICGISRATVGRFQRFDSSVWLFLSTSSICQRWPTDERERETEPVLDRPSVRTQKVRRWLPRNKRRVKMKRRQTVNPRRMCRDQQNNNKQQRKKRKRRRQLTRAHLLDRQTTRSPTLTASERVNSLLEPPVTKLTQPTDSDDVIMSTLLIRWLQSVGNWSVFFHFIWKWAFVGFEFCAANRPGS